MINNILKTAGILTLATATLGVSTANAEDAEILGGTITGWVSAGSDRVFRGESETDDSNVPSLQASYTWTHTDTGIYVGYWAGTNKFATVPSVYAESGPYVGVAGDIGDTGFAYNVFAFQYYYHGDNSGQFDYAELWANLSYQLGDLNLNLQVSPTITDWFGIQDLSGLSTAVTGTYDMGHDWTVSSTLGKQDFSNTDTATANSFSDWIYWDIGVTKAWKGYSIDLRYHDTDFDGSDPGGAWDSKFVFNVSHSF